ncbi:MAG: 2-hydroxychromene-2-carboxylate isomerase [Geminicoccaceae bacterium]|nr:2-hydroxychromene-2-carboxylate isomerase [Geminicoccaceae bacterium]
MPGPIDFYFEFASPYGYMAACRIDDLAARHGREVAWRPIMLGAVFKVTGSKPNMAIPLKGPYLLKDVPRSAKFMGLPLKLPPRLPMNSLAASRAFWWLADDEPDRAKGLALAVYKAHWAEGRDMSSPDQVAEAAATIGIDPASLDVGIRGESVKQRLKDETQAAIDRGVFGSPFIVVDDEPFWGVDRLDQIERRLAGEVF